MVSNLWVAQEKLAAFGSSLLGNILDGLAAFGIVVILLAIGYLFAWVLTWMLNRFLHHLQLEAKLRKHHLHDSLLGFSLTQIANILLWLTVMVTFLGIGADVVQVPFLTRVAAMAIGYMPSLTMGIVILAAGLMIGDYVTDRMKAAKHIPFSNIVAILVELFIAYNALVIAVPLLLPSASTSLLEQSFAIILAAFGLMFGLGGAIAIGLGLKDVVAKVAEKNRDKFNLF